LLYGVDKRIIVVMIVDTTTGEILDQPRIKRTRAIKPRKPTHWTTQRVKDDVLLLVTLYALVVTAILFLT
jgi:hypothetical protein